MSSPSESDWAYLGGLIDGEGHISVVQVRTGKFTQQRLVITNTDLPLLVSVARQFGGKIYGTVSSIKGKSTRKGSFQWYCYGKLVRAILAGVLPYLRGKKEEAELAISLQRNRRLRDVTDRRRLPGYVRDLEKQIAQRIVEIRWRRWEPTDVPADLRQRKARSTHCPAGHLYTDVARSGNCRICQKLRSQEYKLGRGLLPIRV